MAARLEDAGSKPLETAGLVGPADTVDASVMVSTTTPRPGDAARTVGTVVGASPVPAAAEVPRDESADRFEIYQATAPDGLLIWMRRNLETGDTERTTAEVAQRDRAGRAQRAAADAAEDARRVEEAANAASKRASRAAQAAADEARRLSAEAGL